MKKILLMLVALIATSFSAMAEAFTLWQARKSFAAQFGTAPTTTTK